MFHLATPPKFFITIVQRLSAAGLARSENGWRRLVIEKPFGEDEGTARELNEEIRDVFEEEQIYRIDHFLGKETVQNMLVFRFANPSFEPIWNRNYIDHVQITVAEDIGIGTRAGFYEKTGVVRDMVQNHLLQLLCMTTIEPPVKFNGASLRDATANVLEAVQPLEPGECVRGQYGPGTIDGKKVAGYRQEADVASDSLTPTFAAAQLKIDNWRWAGVPFYLRTGKRMAKKLTEVAIHFKPTPHLMFPVSLDQLHSNVLVFRLQPEEGIIQVYAAKRPGPRLRIEPVRSSFLYASAFGVDEPPRAYAWLLLDVMNGDQTLFARVDWIYKAWSIVDPLIEHWEAEPPDDFPNYAAGTWGPKSTEELIQPRAWQLI
jgi:glucose-6-phosphate 1-dehydrogenase